MPDPKTSKKNMILTEQIPTALKGKWQYEQRQRIVRVMALAEGYAMVRLPKAMPFVCKAKDLEDV